MKFGIMNLFPLSEGQSEREVIEETMEEAVLADTLGFDSFWFAEHHFSGYGILGNPIQFGTAVAMATKRITIGTAVMVVPFYNPMRLAEDAALLDILSGGRFMMGCGRGYQPREFAGFHVDPKTSGERYAETIELLRKAWAEDNWDYAGKHFQYEDMTVHPKPLKKEIPILHASVSPESFEKWGRLGERIITSPNFTPLALMKRNFDLYTKGLIEGGHAPDAFERPYMQQVWVGPTETGKREAAEAALRYYRMVGNVIPGQQKGLVPIDDKEQAYYNKVKQGIDLLSVEQTLTHGGNFGSTQQVIDTLGVLQEQLGVTHYICWFRIPSLARGAALDAMHRFAEEVIPAFAEKPVASPKMAVAVS